MIITFSHSQTWCTTAIFTGLSTIIFEMMSSWGTFDLKSSTWPRFSQIEHTFESKLTSYIIIAIRKLTYYLTGCDTVLFKKKCNTSPALFSLCFCMCFLCICSEKFHTRAYSNFPLCQLIFSKSICKWAEN